MAREGLWECCHPPAHMELGQHRGLRDMGMPQEPTRGHRPGMRPNICTVHPRQHLELGVHCMVGCFHGHFHFHFTALHCAVACTEPSSRLKKKKKRKRRDNHQSERQACGQVLHKAAARHTV